MGRRNAPEMTYRDYWTEVDAIAAYISDEDAWRRDYGEQYEATDVLWELVGSHEYVIYTAKAESVMRYTENEDAYPDMHGSMPDAEDWAAMVTAMAGAALTMDVHSRVVDADQRAIQSELRNPPAGYRPPGGRNAVPARRVGAYFSTSNPPRRGAGRRRDPGKWHRGKARKRDGIVAYLDAGRVHVDVYAYKPRSHDRVVRDISRELAAGYEMEHGQKVPKGTRYMSRTTGVGPRGSAWLSAHKRLDSAKKNAVVSL